MPQLPVTTVVTPWLAFGDMSGALSSSAVIMGVHIDEAGRDHMAADVDNLRTRTHADIADRENAISVDRNIGCYGGGAGTVDDLPAPEDDRGSFLHLFPTPPDRKSALEIDPPVRALAGSPPAGYQPTSEPQPLSRSGPA